jgi:CheY-like chemotaxis protein
MSGLAGRRVLVVEDEPILAMALEDMLEELGCTIVGPALRLSAAMALAEEEVDAAILDVNLGGEAALPVAARLRARGVPIMFATGYGEAIAAEHPGIPILPKPYLMHDLARALARLLGEAPPA